MSLLSDLLDNMPPTITGAHKSTMANRNPDRPRLVLVSRVERPVQLPESTYTNAAKATPEWRHTRDQYINHLMTCRACCAPIARYCLAGAGLRNTYDRTPMESHQ